MGPLFVQLRLIVARIVLSQFRENLLLLISDEIPHSAPLISDHHGLSSARILLHWFSRKPLPLMSPPSNFLPTDLLILLVGCESPADFVVFRVGLNHFLLLQ